MHGNSWHFATINMRCLQKKGTASHSNPHWFVTFGATGRDAFTENEIGVWAHLKASPYYAALHSCWSYNVRLPANAWLRLAMQAPAGFDLVEMARIFDEEVRPWQLWHKVVPRVCVPETWS